MAKGFSKGRYNFTIDEGLFEKFRRYCRENCINMSAKVESYIRKEVSAGKNGAK